MDRDTLVNHRDFWTEELSGTRVLRDLPTLDPFEQSLYDDLRNDRLGDRVRLEQERVQYQRVEQAVLALPLLTLDRAVYIVRSPPGLRGRTR